MKTICERKYESAIKTKRDYSEQRRFNEDQENDKYKRAHLEAFIDCEEGGDDYYG